MTKLTDAADKIIDLLDQHPGLSSNIRAALIDLVSVNEQAKHAFVLDNIEMQQRYDADDYWSQDIVSRLLERAAFARQEETGTALGDAVHFEQAAKEIDHLRLARGELESLLEACVREFGWKPYAEAGEPVGEGSEITWGDLHRAYGVLATSAPPVLLKSEHTPGPWKAKQEFSNRWRIESHARGHDLVPVSVGYACTTILEVGGNDKDTAANALLMAAAPELLRLAIQYRDDLRDPPSAFTVKRRLKAIDALIAKAEGGAS